MEVVFEPMLMKAAAPANARKARSRLYSTMSCPSCSLSKFRIVLISFRKSGEMPAHTPLSWLFSLGGGSGSCDVEIRLGPDRGDARSDGGDQGGSGERYKAQNQCVFHHVLAHFFFTKAAENIHVFASLTNL